MYNVESNEEYTTVPGNPVKSFFVDMLTRDISIEDAILDLLDNCVDGILRSDIVATGKKPYEGHYAEITFDESHFSISDNCGGIPWDLRDYAFKLGRSNDRNDPHHGTVGIYGIGMKRAIFKFGRHCLISTQNNNRNYEVEISGDWFKNEDAWDIPVGRGKNNMTEDGTTIYISELIDSISHRFKAEIFLKDLIDKIETHYAFIIHKGFKVLVKGINVEPKPIALQFDDITDKSKKRIRPFIFKTEANGVRVFLAVGFSRHLPSQTDLSSALISKTYSSDYAGWTVLCNDRAVLYCDKTALTGWGEADVPQYHTQFIAISGIVEFQCDDPSKLPTTTTKRGIDTSSQLYLQIKNKMREGLKIFTDYTNKWKTREREAKTHLQSAKAVSITDIKTFVSSNIPEVDFTATHKILAGKQYKPNLPVPEKADDGIRKISFKKTLDEVRTVSNYLELDSDDPSKAGEACFDTVLLQAKK